MTKHIQDIEPQAVALLLDQMSDVHMALVKKLEAEDVCEGCAIQLIILSACITADEIGVEEEKFCEVLDEIKEKFKTSRAMQEAANCKKH